MDTRMTTGTVVALACCAALTLAAQQPRPGPGTPPTPRPSVVGANTVSKETSTATITGCVQPGAGPKTFVLDLSKLIGRQVEASGTVSKPAVSSDQSKSTTRADALSKFSVKSLRETGASC